MALRYAEEAARTYGENYVTSEHLLIGLLHEKDTVASSIVRSMEVDPELLSGAIALQPTRNEGADVQVLQLAPRTSIIVELAYEEAQALDNYYIGAEHMLLGLIREGEGISGEALLGAGVTLEKARQEVITLQNGG